MRTAGGAPLPQCTPSRTFSGDPAGQRVPGGDCGRPSRPGQAQGLGVCTGAPFARSGRRGDSSGVPRARSPQPPAPAASGSQGGVTHSPRGWEQPPTPRSQALRPRAPAAAAYRAPLAVARELESAPVPPRDGRLPSLALRRGGCSAPAGLRRPLWGQAMLHRALPRGRSAPAPPPSPARPAFLSLPLPPPPTRPARPLSEPGSAVGPVRAPPPARPRARHSSLGASRPPRPGPRCARASTAAET